MALQTYAELSAAIADWINRDDLGGRIPAFIALCESKLNRVLRVRQMERFATLSLPPESESAPLPEDFVELRSLRLLGPGGRALRQASLERNFAARGPLPQGFAISGGELRLLPPPAQACELGLLYYGALPPLQSNGANWLLQRHPDVYLYGALAEAQGFVLNQEKLGLWKSLYEEALDQVSGEDRHVRWSGSSLATAAEFAP